MITNLLTFGNSLKYPDMTWKAWKLEVDKVQKVIWWLQILLFILRENQTKKNNWSQKLYSYNIGLILPWEIDYKDELQTLLWSFNGEFQAVYVETWNQHLILKVCLFGARFRPKLKCFFAETIVNRNSL